MKTGMKALAMLILVTLFSTVQTSEICAQRSSRVTVRDHRVKTARKITVRDHRTKSRKYSKNRKGRVTGPKNYRLNRFGKFVPYYPTKTRWGTSAKKDIHCAVVPCPPVFKEGITCWKCESSGESSSATQAEKMKR